MRLGDRQWVQPPTPGSEAVSPQEVRTGEMRLPSFWVSKTHPGNAVLQGEGARERGGWSLLIGNQLESKQESLEVLGCLLSLSWEVTRVHLSAGPTPGPVVWPPRLPSRRSKAPGTEPQN